MAKRKDTTTPANDYLEQIQWRSRYRRLWPVHYEPKWNYKIVYRYGVSLWLDRIAGATLLIGLAIAGIDLFSSDTLSSAAKIFFGTVLGIILTILFFAIRDGSKNHDKKTDDIND